MQETYYLDRLYPFQDKVLNLLDRLDLDFYLTGGTALGRFYLNHRYSEDLGFFVNNHDDFKEQCNTAINELKKRWECDISATSDTFVRIFVQREDVNMKLDFVNDVPSHFGDIQQSNLFHRVDSWRNILSNKIYALSRLEVKDIADIVFISRNKVFDWEIIIAEAKEKDLWVDPLEICRLINRFPTNLLKTIKWIGNVNIEELKKQINVVHDDIFKGAVNSLVGSGK
jgi:hypothetical protein